jgi:hypothetical protein
MAKGRALKELRNIHQLFTPAKPEKPFAQQLAEAENAPPPPEDIDVAMLALMTNYRGWTVGDVQRCLAKHPDADQIPALMNKFVNEGKFEIMTITGRPATYTLKRKPVETITSARNKAAAFKLTDPVGTRQAPDPKGVIVLEEGLDVAIWKVMSDNKARTKNEICAMLAEYKFDRVQINRRVDSMINSRNYFDRRDGGSGGMRYSMKKHVPMPKPLNQVILEEQTALAQIRDNLTTSAAESEREVRIRAMYESSAQGNFAPLHSASREVGSMFSIVSEALNAERAEKVDGASVLAQEEAGAEDLAAVNVAPAAPLNPVIDHAITMAEDDHLTTLIWKAMADFKPYKSEEVHVLVSMFRPTQSLKSVQNKLSELGIEGWFTITKSGRANVYTLKEGISNPNLKVNDLRAAQYEAQRESFKAAAQSTAPKQQELPVQTEQSAAQPEITDNKETEDMSAATNSKYNTTPSLVQVTPKAAPIAAPLIELAIPIKGEKFSFAECRQLVEELRALGYGRESGAVSQLSLVNQQVTIKGIVFEKNELDDIVKALIAEGFGSHAVKR